MPGKTASVLTKTEFQVTEIPRLNNIIAGQNAATILRCYCLAGLYLTGRARFTAFLFEDDVELQPIGAANEAAGHSSATEATINNQRVWKSPMPPDFFDPTREGQAIVFIEDEDVREVEKLIGSCEHCNSEGAEIPFDNILDRITSSDRA